MKEGPWLAGAFIFVSPRCETVASGTLPFAFAQGRGADEASAPTQAATAHKP